MNAKYLALIGIASLTVVLPANAQYTADFQTNIISGVTNYWTGDYYVGSNTFADALLIDSNGVLSNGYGFVGYLLYSSNNNVAVTGAGSIWSNDVVLTIGSSGSGNSLYITNGGRVFSRASGFAGFAGVIGGNATSSNNTVFVSGTNSLWSNGGELDVGSSGPRNSLVVNNGGRVASSLGYIGIGSSSSNNSVLVTGLGSVWTNSSALRVGYDGSGNSLVISNGGRVVSHSLASAAISGQIGVNAGSHSNDVLVTDAGSVWSNAAELHIGYNGDFNSLVISNGGRVVNSLGRIGFNSSSSNNSVLVTGPNSVWTNRSGLYVGYSGAGNSLVISNGGRVASFNNTSLGGYIGFNSSSSNNTVVVCDTGSVWNLSGAEVGIAVGGNGGKNHLVINNGAQVLGGSGEIGSSPGGNGNSVLVTGPGSVWSNRIFFGIGWLGADNSLIISYGGQVITWPSRTDIGVGLASSNNSVEVVDGAIWQNTALSIGVQGSSNSVFVAGGSVFATSLTIGLASSNCDNLLQLDSGNVTVTNVAADAVFEVRYGKFIQNGGLLQVDRFVMTNACAQFVRTGGTLVYGTAMLDPNRDDDGDGISNGWEQSHGRDPLNAADVNADTDDDGQSDLSEFQSGTDPTNSASAFRIVEIAPIDADILLTWTTVGGKKYAVQSVAGGDYTNSFTEFAPAFIAPGTGESEMSVIHLGGATNALDRFYRIRLVP